MRWQTLVALSTMLLGCSSEDVLVANIDVLDGGLPDTDELPPTATGCKDSSECAPNEYCERTTCASPGGQCQLRPIFCEHGRQPVCGCDGVTYWNDCLREQRGASFALAGECTIGAKCRSPQDCPVSHGSCARIVPADLSCPPDLQGSCWVVPNVCPQPEPGEPTFQECGGAFACRLACDAIRFGWPQRAIPCMP